MPVRVLYSLPISQLARLLCANPAQVLHLRHTLALLLLASWCQLEAVSPVDVLRWALDGQLPYLAFGVEEGQVLEQYGSILGRQLITPTGRSAAGPPTQ
jgi:uncharacterized ParB-like nuclease family protein